MDLDDLPTCDPPPFSTPSGSWQSNARLPESRELDSLLDRFEERAISYFLENRAHTGLVLDRALNLPKADPAMPVSGMASIAASGYGLAALAIATDRGMVDRARASALALETLVFVRGSTSSEQRGWMAHFQHAGSGANYRDSEISSIDTVLFVLGAIVAGEAFGGDVKREAEWIFDRLDFRMMLTNDGAAPGKLSFSHGFRLDRGKPEFLRSEWETYSEGILIPLLALASETHPVGAECWDLGWDRAKRWREGGEETFLPLPLFTYYYPLGYLDLKGKRDRRGEDLFGEAENAVRMQVRHCKENGYPDGLFGLTACDGPKGYEAYYPGHPGSDRTIAPLAMLACLPLAESAALSGIRKLDRMNLTRAHYGFAAAFDHSSDWVAPDMIGIDIGSTLLMVDSYRHRTVHRLTSGSRIIATALERAGIS